MYVALNCILFQNMQNPQLAPPSTYVAYSTSSCQQSVGAESNERLCSNTIDSLNDSRNPYSSYALLLPLLSSRVSLLPTNDIPTPQCSNSHTTCMFFVTLQLQRVTYIKLIQLLLLCTTIIILYLPNLPIHLHHSLIQYHRLD